MKTCIAEDDFTSRAMLQAMLRKWGFETVVAEDGAAALALMDQADAPRLLLIDWNMPVVNGLELTRRIRALPGDSPPYIIMLTARTEKEYIIAGLNAGANDYVAKPFDPEILQARLNVGRRMLELQDSLTETRVRLEHEASHDSLTGVYNRKAIMELLAREISRARREKSPLAIGICDLDRFKEVNDTLGHLAGDDVLCGFVARLQAALRPYDFVGRWGGDEFLVVSPGVGREAASQLYQRLRAMVGDQSIPTVGGEVSQHVSMGLAVYDGQGEESVSGLLAAADAALYAAKAGGRDRLGLAPEV
jgi:diguanylate cyclase (GGDEF)-like protein